VDDLEDIDIKQLGLKGSPTIVSKVWAPPKPEGGTIFEGSSQQQVEQLLSVLLEKKELFHAKEGV
jgi:electron transfer flavoprotein beta subunit